MANSHEEIMQRRLKDYFQSSGTISGYVEDFENLFTELEASGYSSSIQHSRQGGATFLVWIPSYSLIILVQRRGDSTLKDTNKIGCYAWLTVKCVRHIFAHLVQGTPPILITFIVCIVTIRKVIHPLTLAVRLAANMIAGHLLLTLLGNTGPIIINSTILIQILILSQILLLILELAVSIIQSYVFTVLTTLYSR
ncbi:ATP synthase subunit a, partial [Gryllus bimaculatus]